MWFHLQVLIQIYHSILSIVSSLRLLTRRRRLCRKRSELNTYFPAIQLKKNSSSCIYVFLFFPILALAVNSCAQIRRLAGPSCCPGLPIPSRPHYSLYGKNNERILGRLLRACQRRICPPCVSPSMNAVNRETPKVYRVHRGIADMREND